MTTQTENPEEEVKNWTARMRDLREGDAPIVADVKYYNSLNQIRIRETRVSGTKFNFRCVQDRVYITCKTNPTITDAEV